jgi:hypothetical protein
MMQQQVGEKAKHEPKSSFQYPLEPGRHPQRILQLTVTGLLRFLGARDSGLRTNES